MSKYHCSKCSSKHSKCYDEGDYYYNSANYEYDVCTCCVQGEKGAKGDKGAQGNPGNNGTNGTNGAPGTPAEQIVRFAASLTATVGSVIDAYLIPWAGGVFALPVFGVGGNNQLLLTTISPSQTLPNNVLPNTYKAFNPILTLTLIAPIAVLPVGSTTFTLGTLTGAGLLQTFNPSTIQCLQ